MYFFEMIEGAKGERLTSSVLKYLFVNSVGFRRRFLQHKQIRDEFSHSKLPSFRNGVICFDEYPTDAGDGFIDLVVIADNTVLGIENKLWAVLTDNQPAKYLPTLKRLALERVGNEEAFRILMLVPDGRRDEMWEELRKQNVSRDVAIVLTWELLKDEFQFIANEEAGEVGFVSAAFHEYLARHLSDVSVNAEPTKLIGDVPMGNAFQQDFLNKVWEVFENAGRVRAGGKGNDGEWYGFSFAVEQPEADNYARPWFGFVRAGSVVTLLVQTRQAAVLLQELGGAFRQSDRSVENDVWLEVVLDKSDDSILKWKTKLRPVFDELWRLTAKTPALSSQTMGDESPPSI